MSDVNLREPSWYGSINVVVLIWYKGWRRVRGRWGGTERECGAGGDSSNDRGLR